MKKRLCVGLCIPKNMANFEGLCWNISSNINLLFLKSDTIIFNEILYFKAADIYGNSQWSLSKNLPLIPIANKKKSINSF